MASLKKADRIKMKYGQEATVLEEFGSGGQGTVYKVEYRGKEYALKWYHKDVFKGKGREFYDNLEKNIQKGAPTEAFLWPEAITEVLDGQFGYLMRVRPAQYHELTEFFVGTATKKQVHFRSFHAVVDAAIHIIEGFRELHNRGYSYQDINNGNFFIHPDNGDVLICDNDNVSPFGTNLGILGKQRYMAPEIVEMKNDPDKQSDRFSLAVILFRLLFVNHPLEGRYSTPPCMTKELEKKYYGTDPVFIYDDENKVNRPIPGTDYNLKLLWGAYPTFVHDAFKRAFSKEVMKDRTKRIIEREWLDVFFKLKTSIVTCPHCGHETLLDHVGDNLCIEPGCRKTFHVSNAIRFNQTELPVYQGSRIMMWQVDSTLDHPKNQICEVIANPRNRELLGILNTSSNTWRVLLSDGSCKTVGVNQVMPIQAGLKIQFTSDEHDYAEII